MNRLENNEDLISLIVPVYNCEKYLSKCIESIINQTYKNIELILVNDASIDSSGKICNRYKRDDSRIKVIHNSINGGPGLCRNIGIKNALGKFILFIDGDDYIDHMAIEVLNRRQTEHFTDLIISNFNIIIDDNKIIKYKDPFFYNKNKKSKELLIFEEDILSYVNIYLKQPNEYLSFTYCWGKLYSSDIIKKNKIKFDENLRIFEDIEFNYRYLKYVKKVLYVKEPLFNYSIRNNYSSAGMNVIDNLVGNANKLQKSINQYLNNHKSINESEIRSKTGHAMVFLIIVHLIRSCGHIKKSNKKRIYNLVNKIVYDRVFQENLASYYPAKGNSKILPLLMRLKYTRLIMLYCKHKAYKRYGKGEK